MNLPNRYSSSIILKDSDFTLANRTWAIVITAEMSFRTALAADFERKYRNKDFLWMQGPGIGGVSALPPAASQIPVFKLLGDEGDGEAACRPRGLGPLPDQAERLPSREGVA